MCISLCSKRKPQVYEPWVSRQDVEQKPVEIDDPTHVAGKADEEEQAAEPPPKISIHPADKAMMDFWPDQGSSTEGGKEGKPLYSAPTRNKTALWIRMLDNTMRLGPGRRLHQLKMTRQRTKQLRDQVNAGLLTATWLFANFGFLACWMDEAAEQHAAFCYLAFGWECCVVLRCRFSPAQSIHKEPKDGRLCCKPVTVDESYHRPVAAEHARTCRRDA